MLLKTQPDMSFGPVLVQRGTRNEEGKRGKMSNFNTYETWDKESMMVFWARGKTGSKKSFQFNLENVKFQVMGRELRGDVKVIGLDVKHILDLNREQDQELENKFVRQ